MQHRHAQTLVWLLFYSSAFKAFFLTPLCVQSFLFYLRGERKYSEVYTVYLRRLPIFEFAVDFHLMLTCNDGHSPDLRPRTGKDLGMSHNQRSRVNIIVWGLHKELTTLEVRAKFVDMGLESFVRGNVLWGGDHIRRRRIVRAFLAR